MQRFISGPKCLIRNVNENIEQDIDQHLNFELS